MVSGDYTNGEEERRRRRRRRKEWEGGID